MDAATRVEGLHVAGSDAAHELLPISAQRGLFGFVRRPEEGGSEAPRARRGVSLDRDEEYPRELRSDPRALPDGFVGRRERGGADEGGLLDAPGVIDRQGLELDAQAGEVGRGGGRARAAEGSLDELPDEALRALRVGRELDLELGRELDDRSAAEVLGAREQLGFALRRLDHLGGVARPRAPREARAMSERLSTMTYDVDGRVARITLDRPARGNGITLEMPRELAACVERADLDPSVHVIALSGRGKGFCGGYDLVASAETRMGELGGDAPEGSPLDPAVQARNHVPGETWDPMVDFQMMNRNVRGFMSLFHADKPVVCKVHGFCVAGGTDMALCSDLLVIESDAKIGYPPARVWGVPTTALWVHRIGLEKAKRLLFTGDCLSGREAVEWGLAIEHAPAAELDERAEVLLGRIARVPVNQLVMHKRLLNQTVMTQGLYATQTMGVLYDGVARHTPEGHAFATAASERGFKAAVRDRDEPFGDLGPSTFKG